MVQFLALLTSRVEVALLFLLYRVDFVKKLARSVGSSTGMIGPA